MKNSSDYNDMTQEAKERYFRTLMDKLGRMYKPDESEYIYSMNEIPEMPLTEGETDQAQNFEQDK